MELFNFIQNYTASSFFFLKVIFLWLASEAEFPHWKAKPLHLNHFCPRFLGCWVLSVPVNGSTERWFLSQEAWNGPPWSFRVKKWARSTKLWRARHSPWCRKFAFWRIWRACLNPACCLLSKSWAWLRGCAREFLTSIMLLTNWLASSHAKPAKRCEIYISVFETLENRWIKTALLELQHGVVMAFSSCPAIYSL